MNKKSSITKIINKIINKDLGDKTNLDEILAQFGKRTYGPIFFIIGVISTSPIGAIPGLPFLMTFLTCTIVLQYLFKRGAVWMPQFIVKKSFSKSKVDKVLTKIIPITKFIDKITRPRAHFFFNSFFEALIMITVMLMSILFIPLGFIPAGIMFPGIVIICFSIAIITKDGILAGITLLFSFITTGIAISTLI